MQVDPLSVLRQTFGYQEFRGAQREIIERLVFAGPGDGHVLLLMPTGGGKSLCYQIPALCLDGGTIVISPLIALMQDQVEALRKKNIPATFINSTVSKAEREARLEGFINGAYKMLYVTPERFRKPEFISGLQRADIALLAVDEAHCVSAWGHDFRPDYSRIGEFRELLGNPLTIALTATATAEVQRDIVDRLHLDPARVRVVHEGIGRPNLRLEAREVFSDKEKLDTIIETLENYRGSGIIYFSLIKTLEEISGRLRDKRIPHGVYHGKLSAEERRRSQRRFMRGENELMLATNAFGMGIDKADIRLIIHAEVPSSIESYYQEIGRAGRDGRDSLCMLIYIQEDLSIQMEFIKWSNPDSGFYSRLYGILKGSTDRANAMGADFLREEMTFKNRRDFRVETALGMLDRYGVTAGELENRNLRVVADLPDELMDDEALEAKRLNDNRKLLSLVQYFRGEECRRLFINEYFGFHDEPPCGNCDRCSEALADAEED